MNFYFVLLKFTSEIVTLGTVTLQRRTAVSLGQTVVFSSECFRLLTGALAGLAVDGLVFVVTSLGTKMALAVRAPAAHRVTWS